MYCIMGRSASGKSTLAREAAKHFNYKVVKSYTTRPIRPGENPETTDHIFITKRDVIQYEGHMVAKTEINGYLYFTTIEMLRESDIYVIDH